jgi:hypothetical protein
MAAFDSTVKGFFDSLSGIMPFQPESKALGGSKSNIKEVIKSEVTSPLGDLSNFFAGIDKSLVRLVEFAKKTFNLEKKEDERDKQTSDLLLKESEEDKKLKGLGDVDTPDEIGEGGDNKSMLDSIKDSFASFGDAFGQVSIGEKLGAALLIGGLLLFNSVQDQLVAVLTPIIAVVKKMVEIFGAKGTFMIFLTTLLAIKYRALIKSAIGVAKSLGPAIWTGIGKAFTGINIASKFLLKGAQGALRALSGGMTKLFNGVGLAFKAIRTGMLAMKASLVPMIAPFLPIIAAAAAVVAVFVSLKSGFDVFKQSLENGDSMFVAVLKGLQDAMLTLVTLPYVLVQKLVGFIAGLFGFDNFKKQLESFDIKEKIVEAFSSLTGGLVKILKAVAAGAGAALASVFKFKNPIKSFSEAYSEVMAGGEGKSKIEKADEAAGIDTGDGSIAETIGKERNEKIKKKANFMNMVTDQMDQDIEDKTYFARDHLRTGEQQDKYLNRKDQSTDMLFEMNKADKLAYDKNFDKTGQPIMINTTNQGDVYNQKSETNVSGELSTDHSDRTARAIEDAMMA